MNTFISLKILGRLVEPFTVVLLLISIGCAMTWFERKARTGRWLLTCGVTLLLLLVYRVPFNMLAGMLENEYEPILDTHDLHDVRWIVILGGGHTSSRGLPVNSQVGASALFRIVEAVRLHRAIPGSRLLFSGGATFDTVPHAQLSSAVGLDLGVERDAVLLERRPRTTAEEVSCIRGVVGSERFILVTTATHMPRAMMLAEGFGLHAIPSPTDFRTGSSDTQALRALPDAGAPLLASAAFHELAGLAWLRIKAAMGRPLVTPAMCADSTEQSGEEEH